MSTRTSEWIQAAVQGRVEEAERLRAKEGGWPSDGSDDARALAVLTSVVSHAHRKDWEGATAALPVDRPADWLDWDLLAERLEVLAESQRLKRASDVDGALALLRASTDRPLGPLLADVLTELGTVQLLVGEREDAAALLERALALRPTHPRALTNRGNLLLEEGDLDGAMTQYRAALDVDFEYAPARHNLGVALRRQGRFAASIRELRRAQRHTVKRARESQRLRPRRSRQASNPEKPRERRGLKWLVAAAVLAALWLFFIR